MSYAVPPAKARPTVVAVAVRLLYLLAAIQAITFGASFAQYPALQQVLADESFAQADRDLMRTAMVLGTVFAAVLSVAFITAFVALGVFVGRGKQPARVVTWVFVGLEIFFIACAVGRSGLESAQSGSQTIDPELRARFEELSPGWHETLMSVRSVVVVVVLIAIAILLSLSAVHEFFQQDDLAWCPSISPWPGTAVAAPMRRPRARCCRHHRLPPRRHRLRPADTGGGPQIPAAPASTEEPGRQYSLASGWATAVDVRLSWATA